MDLVTRGMTCLGCFLHRELKDNILAGQLLVHTLEGLHLPLCAVPVLGVQVHLHIIDTKRVQHIPLPT